MTNLSVPRFIKGPDAAYMLALIATCSPHQVDALRSVIYDYISRETSLSVHLRVRP